MNKDKNTESRQSFTLAELLITFTVVGVVAAMTIPPLIISVDNLKWNAGRQKMVDNIESAVAGISYKYPQINGLGNAANFRDELARNLNVIKSCDTVTDCFPATIKDMAGNNVTTPTSGAQLSLTFIATATPGAAVGMILNNGASLNIIYNSACTENDPVNGTYGADHVCANIIFDLNGFAPPNQTGKDIGFISVIDPKATTVAGVNPDTADYTEGATTAWNWSNAISKCKAKGADWYLPNYDELNSLIYNKKIIGNFIPSSFYWSSSEYVPDPANAKFQGVDDGALYSGAKSITPRVRCVRR